MPNASVSIIATTKTDEGARANQLGRPFPPAAKVEEREGAPLLPLSIFSGLLFHVHPHTEEREDSFDTKRGERPEWKRRKKQQVHSVGFACVRARHDVCACGAAIERRKFLIGPWACEKTSNELRRGWTDGQRMYGRMPEGKKEERSFVMLAVMLQSEEDAREKKRRSYNTRKFAYRREIVHLSIHNVFLPSLICPCPALFTFAFFSLKTCPREKTKNLYARYCCRRHWALIIALRSDTMLSLTFQVKDKPHPPFDPPIDLDEN